MLRLTKSCISDTIYDSDFHSTKHSKKCTSMADNRFLKSLITEAPGLGIKKLVKPVAHQDNRRKL